MIAVGNSNTANRLKNACNIKLQGAVNGSANFNGSSDITITTTQNNIAIISGSAPVTAGTGEVIATENYPEGFTKDNCVVIAFGSHASRVTGFSFGYNSNTSSGILTATNDRNVTLGDEGIDVWYNNITTSTIALYYKIVLMKVS